MKKTTQRFLLTLGLLMASASCYAQFNGNVQGTVQDAKGAVVPNATVTLIAADTGVKQQAESNANGVYRFASLAPGNYTVSTTVQGFTTATVSFNLATDQTRDVSLVLTVAAVSSTVNVTTQAALLDTSDSRLEQTLDTTALTDLPLQGRNPTNVITMAPGVTGTGRQTPRGRAHPPTSLLRIGSTPVPMDAAQTAISMLWMGWM